MLHVALHRVQSIGMSETVETESKKQENRLTVNQHHGSSFTRRHFPPILFFPVDIHLITIIIITTLDWPICLLIPLDKPCTPLTPLGPGFHTDKPFGHLVSWIHVASGEEREGTVARGDVFECDPEPDS